MSKLSWWARPRHIVRPHSIFGAPGKQHVHKKKFAGKSFTGKKSVVVGGVRINDGPVQSHSKVAGISSPSAGGKGKGLALAHPVIHVDSSDDDLGNEALSTIPPSLCDGCKVGAIEQPAPKPLAHSGVKPLLPPIVNDDDIISPVPMRVIYPSELIDEGFLRDSDNFLKENHVMFKHEAVNYGLIDDIYNLEDHVHENFPEGYISQQECSFHSINSKTSIIRQIEGMGVEGANIQENMPASSSAKRRKMDSNDESSIANL